MMGCTVLLCCTLTMPAAEVILSESIGTISEPAYDNAHERPGPTTPYVPQEGDIVLLSNPNFAWRTAYMIAKTGSPGHSGVVVTMRDGQLGLLEAGYEGSLQVRVTPLTFRLAEYKGWLWVRHRKCPLTVEQSARMTEFAHTIDRKPYAVLRLLMQITPFRSRGPIRTYLFGKPRGIRSSYICSEAVLESLVYADLLEAETTRPSATYPEDMFFDHSTNKYINENLHLQDQWEKPALWHRK